jgi:hypothetical protein
MRVINSNQLPGGIMGKYPALNTVSVLLRCFGWVVLVVGIILLIVGLGQIANTGSEQSLVAGMSGAAGVLTIGAGGSLVVMGLLTVAFGEFARVLIDIEFNTRSGAKPPLESVSGNWPAESGAETLVESLTTNDKLADPMNDQELMSKYGITYDGKKFKLNEYTYDKLADAVNFARKVEVQTK